MVSACSLPTIEAAGQTQDSAGVHSASEGRVPSADMLADTRRRIEELENVSISYLLEFVPLTL